MVAGRIISGICIIIISISGNLYGQEKVNNEKYDVIVVGAGAAGLKAARDLKDHGKSVLVLEGSDRAGGRIKTDYMQPNKTPIDLGAETIHEAQSNPISEIARKVGLGSRLDQTHELETPEEQKAYEELERLIDQANQRYELGRRLEEYAEDISKTISKDYSVQNAVDNYIATHSLSENEKRLLQQYIRENIETEEAAEASKLSLLGVLEEYNDNEDAFLAGNYYRIVNYIKQPIEGDIRYNEKVTAISYNNDGVTVSTEQGEIFYAKYVIITVSLGVLRNNVITFTPALPKEKVDAISQLQMGVLDKVILRFPRQFWDTWRMQLDPLFNETFWAFDDRSDYFKEPVLMGFSVGDTAKNLEQESDEKIKQKAMDLLRSRYGTNIPDPVYFQVTRWWQDPFSYGSYAYVPVGASLKNDDILRKPVAKKVFFAGEATSEDDPGSVSGAYVSGQREAERIINLES